MRYASNGLVLLCALCAIACSKQEVAQAVEDTPAVEKPAEKPTMTTASFDPDRTYGDRISASAERSYVIRNDAAYDALVSRLPKTKIQKKNPADPSDDRLLERPPVDFSKEMIVVATCGTFYCPIKLESYRIDGGTLTVLFESPGEGEDSMMMGARPVGMNGGDEYGNYAAAVIPLHSGEVAFEKVTPK